jgi:L-serine dehydratase
MALSVFDLFRVGIGPSSSHTVGPMRAASMFIDALAHDGLLGQVARVHVELCGSLGATGRGHGSVGAVLVGLEGADPRDVDPELPRAREAAVANGAALALGGSHAVSFDLDRDLVLDGRRRVGHHSNAMIFEASDRSGEVLLRRRCYSVGGGFVADDDQLAATSGEGGHDPTGFESADELLERCEREGISISEVVRRDEERDRTSAEVDRLLLEIADVMRATIEVGSTTEGELPGGLHVRRRAKAIRAELEGEASLGAPPDAMEWVSLWALAVGEENAAGGRIVTAPTNGAAGIIPAVLEYYRRFVAGADDAGVVRFLLASAAVGFLYKRNASISGAEVGCQGEVGSACSMAAAGLAEVLGGTPAQVENAAEIGIEHNLGLTCDPVGGLVQIPCIERNAVAATKAITAARMAIRGDGSHRVSLDRAIRTMRDTGADMADKYKETALGGLALNIVEC